ncbi:MAG TPA: hypothetical protein VFI65_30635, partial [Streptosporangiaceae bacterium]|nr:hypothetical protein [Streptosporangiaceae bacterium]
MLRYPPTQYPETDLGLESDDYHGELIADPYRWLETTTDPKTLAWIAAQNSVTEAVLSGVSRRPRIKAELTALASYARDSVPFERGGRWFQFRNSGLQNQPVLYVMEAPDRPGTVLLDPNAEDPEGTTAVSSAAVSEDGRLLAYAYSVAGSDWQTWRVRDVASGKDTEDLVEWSKFSTAAWRKDGSGFYYLAPERPPAGEEYLAQIGQRRVMFHKIGTDQSEDEFVFASPENSYWHSLARISEDGRFLIISSFNGTAPQASLRVLDLSDPAAELTTLIDDFDSIADLVCTQGSTFFLVTD